MSIRSLLGLDLTGQLRARKHCYKSDTSLFDHTTVWCSVSTWSNGTASIGASAYCNDPAAWGLDTRPIGRFYSSPTVGSTAKAERQLEDEVVRASKKLPETSFFDLAPQGHMSHCSGSSGGGRQ